MSEDLKAKRHKTNVNNAIKALVESQAAKIKELTEREAKLSEALRFYADRENYYMDNGIPVFDSSQETEIYKDNGKVAKATLSELSLLGE